MAHFVKLPGILDFFSRHKKVVSLAAAVFLLIVIAGLVLFLRAWPFTEERVSSDLGSALSANVHFGSFRRKYFPPGCIADNVTFQRNSSNQPIVTVRRLTITSNLLGLIRRHIRLINAEGVQVVASPRDFMSQSSSHLNTVVDELNADGATLQIASRTSGANHHNFKFYRFTITNLGGGGVIHFSAFFENPLPRGELGATGEFGPWKRDSPEQVPVSGSYSLESADLGVFPGIGGILSSKGDFKGTFKSIQVRGTTQTPKFEVTNTGHTLPLETRFDAAVDAASGDVVLQHVKARLGKTDINADGTIARGEDRHRVAHINLTSAQGHVEDVFYLFVHAKTSPLYGTVNFKMKVALPGGSQPFLKRVGLESTFQIQQAKFANPQTQGHLNEISQPSGHEDPNALALSQLTGQVRLEHGFAHFADLSLQDSGAAAAFKGTYSLTDERIDMHGKLRTRSLSNGSHGFKKVVLKVISPFFKKNPKQTEAPVKISGTYRHPAFGLDTGS
jgi:AsmA-like C-terminal region